MKITNSSNNSFLKPIKMYSVFNSVNFYCDFETILVDNIHYVSCFSIVGPRINYYKSLLLTDNIKYNSNQLILSFITICAELKINFSSLSNKKILFLFHNFNKFDSFFIINSL